MMSAEEILANREKYAAKTDKFGVASGSPVISVLFNHIDNLNAEIVRLRQAEAAARAEERETCAGIADGWTGPIGQWIAKSIRARKSPAAETAGAGGDR